MTQRSKENPADIPSFIEEAFESDPKPAPAEVARSLAGLVGEPPPSEGPGFDTDASVARLLAAVENVPARYAPFYDRLGELFDLDERAVVALLSRTDWAKSGLPGIRIREVEGGPRRKGCELRLVDFAKGAYFPRHVHKGLERIFVLEGGYRDESSVDYGPGDLHEMTEGSRHSFRVHADSPCVAASVLGARFEFEAWPLWLLDKVLRG